MSTSGQPSASALNVARCRAIAAHEARAAIKGHDTLAELFLDAAARQSLKDPVMHGMILKRLNDFSPGSYEFFIARTAYLDEAVEEALKAGIPQVVLLGAGYDTRVHRFRHLLGATRVFELDEPVTQSHKRTLLEQAECPAPEHLTYVPINFTSDSLANKLTDAGYRADQKAIFVWEGVTYYLPPQTVKATLRTLRDMAPPGSLLCFDYMIPASQMEGRYGAQQARAGMQALYNTAEPLLFDLDEAQVAGVLEAHGFELVEHLNAADMQQRYLSNPDGTPVSRILDLFRLVKARVAGA